MMTVCHFEAMDSVMRFQFRFSLTGTMIMLYAFGANGFYMAILAWFLIGIQESKENKDAKGPGTSKPNLSSKNVETERKVDDKISLMHSDSCCFRPTCLSLGVLWEDLAMGARLCTERNWDKSELPVTLLFPWKERNRVRFELPVTDVLWMDRAANSASFMKPNVRIPDVSSEAVAKLDGMVKVILTPKFDDQRTGWNGESGTHCNV
ncbi:hypothetical protein LguiB_012767 [Lonicera macranthoides]